MNLESSGSSQLAETIVKFQDKIQDTKFAIASLKIQLAFRILIKIFNKKKTLYSTRIFERLKDISTKQISACMKEPIQKIFATLEIIRERNLLKNFTKIKVYAETVEKQYSSIKRISSFNSLNDSKKKINNSSQGFQTNVYQMSGEQMDEQCTFLKDQIKKIEKSFQDFYNNLQKH